MSSHEVTRAVSELPSKIRLGMVGGGIGALIGPIHRIAARLDDRFELVAGAFSSDRERARHSATRIGLAPERAYLSYADMVEAEGRRADGIEAVSIVTPNDTHVAIASAFLGRGIHVICDKPVACTAKDAVQLARLARDRNRILAVTYNYSGYPMVRQARAMCLSGELGKLRLVEVHYLQDWLAEAAEQAGSKQAQWRTDPARAGQGGAIADIGGHAYHLIRFVTGLKPTSLCAELSSFVPGRRVDDDARVLLRFDEGAKGLLWVSQVALGHGNDLSIRVCGERGSLRWRQEVPDQLWHAPRREAPRCIIRGGSGVDPSAARITRTPVGHPEGFLEAFGTLYSEIASAIMAARQGRPCAREVLFPSIDDGVDNACFIEAALRSNASGCAWQCLGSDDPG